MGWKVGQRCKGKTLLGAVNKLFATKSLLIATRNVLPKKNQNKKFKRSQLLEGDEIKSILPFKIFRTLNDAPSDFFLIHCAAIVKSKNEDFPHFPEEYGTSSNKGI